jgi:hypothetical protein
MLSSQKTKELIKASVLRVKIKTGKVFYKLDDEWFPAHILPPEDKRAPDCVYPHRPLSIRGKIYYHLKVLREKEVSIKDIVWIAAHGLFPKGYVVMHYDGNAWNNGIDNLVLVPRKKYKVVYHLFYIEVWKWWDKVDWNMHPTWSKPPVDNWFDQLDQYQLSQKQWEKLLGKPLEKKAAISAKQLRKYYQPKKKVDLDFD